MSLEKAEEFLEDARQTAKELPILSISRIGMTYLASAIEELLRYVEDKSGDPSD